ncbi:surfeit locus protein 5 subunit 22 of mediator complex-domain-containing protein [Syncephalis pseudoplumigaleata]|uniref:Surfeit locus protein 5 subunit 22 of mediator complex-domain-containing protein n=1 Tax=Syncephalis pseudoplumigaleata TaxID=1712513 RepID=A0A4P9YYF4_9FUNG|nr:surfeit locus protein 5 subunit 22 of mediator complex-domain-containing protein [Syncephalis pseudoplumigaleata]|eukprot:RKP25136.1 surfeit locus protein 5 subunit 22 of mediator complex-domain-containing protein [Syncephalis pseudoplumigaleata]
MATTSTAAAASNAPPLAQPPASSLTPGGQQPATSLELLSELEESRHRRLDNELDQLADGFAEIIRTASVTNKDKFQLAEEGFALETRATSILFAAESLMSMVSELKRTFVLNETQSIASMAAQRIATLQQEQQQMRDTTRQMVAELDVLLQNMEHLYFSTPYRR